MREVSLAICDRLDREVVIDNGQDYWLGERVHMNDKKDVA